MSGSDCLRGACLLALIVACSGRTENFANTGFVDREGADASVRDRSAEDSGSFTDAALSSDVKEEVDRWELYCNIPSPGPCCCEGFEIELRANAVDAANSCEFVVTPPGRYRVRDERLVHLDARLPDGGREALAKQESCIAESEGWILVSTDPAVIRLCPRTCSRLDFGEYEAIVVRQACYSIACPPF